MARKRRKRSSEKVIKEHGVRRNTPSHRLTLRDINKRTFTTSANLAQSAVTRYGRNRVILFPQVVTRPPREASYSPSRLPNFPLVIAPDQRDFSHKKKSPCVNRKTRREVLFAIKRVGRGSGNSRIHIFDENSKERC